MQWADARTLIIILLHMRDIENRLGELPVSEMLRRSQTASLPK